VSLVSCLQPSLSVSTAAIQARIDKSKEQQQQHVVAAASDASGGSTQLAVIKTAKRGGGKVGKVGKVDKVGKVAKAMKAKTEMKAAKPAKPAKPATPPKHVWKTAPPMPAIGAESIRYKGGVIYTSPLRKCFRIIQRLPDYATECNVSWGDSRPTRKAWATALKRIDTYKGK
jgi:hypothetical protein